MRRYLGVRGVLGLVGVGAVGVRCLLPRSGCWWHATGDDLVGVVRLRPVGWGLGQAAWTHAAATVVFFLSFFLFLNGSSATVVFVANKHAASRFRFFLIVFFVIFDCS